MELGLEHSSRPRRWNHSLLVSILVLMELGLEHLFNNLYTDIDNVSILVLMELGLERKMLKDIISYNEMFLSLF